MSSSSSGMAVSVSESASPCHRQEGDVAPVTKGPMEGSAKLPVSWLLSGEEEQVEFHVSICAGAISPASAGHSSWMRCLLPSDNRVLSPIRRPDKSSMVNALVTKIRDFIPAGGQDACAASPRVVAASGLLCGFRGDAWVSEFQTAHHSVNACVVSPRSFGGAAGLSVFQLWVQGGAAQSALAESCPRPVSKSFLRVGDVVVRRQDTSRARVQVIEPLVGDAREAQVSILVTCCQAPLERSVLFRRPS